MENDLKQKQAIASRVTLARKQAGLTQGQAAKLLELHRPTVSEIEAGRRNITGPELAKFADIYGVSAAWLACSESDSNFEEDRVNLAARELAKLAPDDLDKVLGLLKALRRSEPKQ